MAYIMNMDKVPYPVPVSVVCEADLQRGLILEIVGRAENNIWVDGADNEAYKVQLAGNSAERGSLLIHTSVPFSYDEKAMEQDFVLKAGEIGRGHHLNVGDEYTLPAEMIDGEVAEGADVALGGNGKLAIGGSTVIAEVVRVYVWNGQESVRIRIK